MQSPIPQEHWLYPSEELGKWKSGALSLLCGLPVYLRDFLTRKASVRQGQRFFGEAWVLAKPAPETDRPWFNSYKWLTANAWTSGKFDPQQNVERLFYQDLLEYLGKDALDHLQAKAREYCEKHPGQPKLYPPDLVLLNKAPRKSHFIEIKLPGDRPRTGQEEALTIIAKHIPADIRIISLRPEPVVR